MPEETPANEPDSDEVQIFNLSEDTPYDCFVASGGVLKAVDNENGERDLILEGANVGYTVKRHLY